MQDTNQTERALPPGFPDPDVVTPSLRQFIETKQKYPETLVLYRMGDFYETFFDDAVKANRLIGITLTKRGKTIDGDPIPMAGIPMVSLDQYIARLVRMGESVVIVEQVGQPQKNGSMERKVARIITPGTLTETSLLPEKADAILLAIEPPKRKRGRGRPAKNPDGVYGFVWLTLSNGDFRAEEVSPEQFESELARLSPSEILVSDAFREKLRESHPDLVVTTMPDWHFDAEHGEKLLCDKFGLDNLDAWGVTGRNEVLSAANALLDYTEETQVDMMPFILPMKLVHESEFIVIDPASRRNLEISSTIKGEKDGLTLFSVLDQCESAMGSRELCRWLNQPLRDRSQAEARHEAIEALMNDSTLLSTVVEKLAAIPDIERFSSRIALGTVRPRELASLRDALPAAKALAALLGARSESLFTAHAKALAVPPEVQERLQAALLEEPAVFLRDGDVIASSYNEELENLRKLRDDTGEFLLQMEAREREATNIPTLRVEYNKVQGFYIEVTKSFADKVPIHYHRRQTLKNVERFITPELKAFEDKALSAKERTAQLEKTLYEELIGFLKPHVEALMQAAHALAGLDALTALARHAAKRHWVRPELTARPGINIRAGRHPVVETTLEVYVPNSCRL